MNNLKEQIYNDVVKMYEQRVGITRLRETLIKNFEQEVPLELIREIISEIKQGKQMVTDSNQLIKEISESKAKEREDGGLKEVVKGIGDKKLYDYSPETDHIIFYPDGKPYPVLRTTVLAMHEKYSKDGENLSGKQMQYEFQLTPKARQYIKSVLNLYKDSVPFDVITLSQMTSKEDMEKAAKDKAEQLTEAKMRRVYDQQITSSKDALLKKLSNDNKTFEDRLDNIANAIKRFRPQDFDNIKLPKVVNNDTKRIVIGDAHLGKKDTDGIIIRFRKLTRDIIESTESNVVISFLGDLGEQFIPRQEKHPGMKLGMENIDLEDLFLLVLDTFQQMLLDIAKSGKTVTFNGLGGNHDSFEVNKDLDPLRSPALIMYRLLEKLVVGTNIKINILRNKVNIIKDGKIKFLFAHGDKVTENTVKGWALQYLDDKHYLMIITADKHHFDMKEISDRVSWLKIPALAGKGKYDDELGLSSLPGALELIENQDGLIDTLVRRYK